MRLYYLTGPQFALSNLALRRLKISRFSDLNDPFELLAIDLKDKAHRDAFRKVKDELNDSKGLICFSRSWSNPLLWGHYGEKHTGIALGFEVDERWVTQVIYARVPRKIRIDKKTNKPVLSEKLMNDLLRTKFHDWKYENEIRLFINLDHEADESGLYFLDFSAQLQLREVILGPRCTLPLASIRAIVSGMRPAVSVIKSRIAISSFRVVETGLQPVDS